MSAGRPMTITTPEEFDALVEEYVSRCRAEEEPVTLTGLILALGLSSRQSLDQYQEREQFYDSVKRAKLIVENEYEKRLATVGGSGNIFALKNFGWTDKREISQQTQVNTTMSYSEATALLREYGIDPDTI